MKNKTFILHLILQYFFYLLHPAETMKNKQNQLVILDKCIFLKKSWKKAQNQFYLYRINWYKVDNYSIKSMHQQKDIDIKRKDVFRTIAKADRIAKTITGTVVVIMGLTRSGKSATFNLVLAPQTMIGSKMGTNNFYVPLNNQEYRINPEIQLAEISTGMQSLTIMPNIGQLKLDNITITLMDFAGFGDQRKPLEILTVNYIQTTFLKSIRDIKFTVAFTQKAFDDISNNGFQRTLQEFLNIFDFKKMIEDEDRNEFYSSISFLVTSATNIDLEDMISQLKYIKEQFQILHQQNPNIIPNFQIVEGLLSNIIKYNRIDVSPISKVKRVAQRLDAIQRFWSKDKGWNSFKLYKHADKIQSSYMEQFYSLNSKDDQKMLKQIIKWRFDQCNKMNSIVCQIMKKIIENIGMKEYDLKEELNDLKVNFIDDSFYQSIPSFEQETNQIILVPLQQRVEILCKIIGLSFQLKHQTQWTIQQNQNVESKEGYIKFLETNFKKELKLLNNLCGATREIRIMFKKLEFMFTCMFTEAITLILLDTEFAGDLLIHLQQDINWGNTLDILVEDLKIKFIKTLQIQTYELGYFSNLEIQNLINYSLDQEPKIKDLSPTIVYSIAYKLILLQNSDLQNKLLLSKDKSKQKLLNQEIIQNLLKAFSYTLQHAACINKKKKKLNEKEKQQQNGLLRIQKNILTKIFNSISSLNNINLILEICQQLKQYSQKCRYFEIKISNQPHNADLIRQYAQYCKEIGYCEKSIELYEQLKRINPRMRSNFEQRILQVSKQSPQLLQIHRKLVQEQKQMLLDCAKGLDVINKIGSQILNKNENIILNFNEIHQKYMKKMKNTFAFEEFQFEFPKNPTNHEYIEICHQLIAKTKNKKLTILISAGPKTGQTTLFYQILGRKLNLSNGKYYLNQNYKGESKINNSGTDPTIFPNICPLNDKQELLVDFPLLFNSSPQKILIITGIFQQMLKQCQQFRLILVIRQNQILQNNGGQFISLINYLLTIFKFAQIQNNGENAFNNPICQSVVFIFTFTNEQINMLIKRKMDELRDCLLDVDNIRAIQNERRYQLTRPQQKKCYYIIKSVIKKGRYKYIMNNKLFNDLTQNTDYDVKWHYIKSGYGLRNMGQILFLKMMESQRNRVTLYIQNKFNIIKQILTFLMRLTLDNYNYHLQNEINSSNISILNNFEAFILPYQKQINMIHLQQNKNIQEVRRQIRGQMKLLSDFRLLIQLKLISFDEINVSISNWDRPGEFFDRLIEIIGVQFNNIANMCCSDQKEQNMMKKAMMFTKSILIQIQSFAYVSEQSSTCLSQSMCRTLQIKNLSEAILTTTLHEIIQQFLNIFNESEFKHEFERQCLDNCQSAENSLLNYQYILSKIYFELQKQQNRLHLITQFQPMQERKKINQKLIIFYQRWKKQKQLCLAYIDKIFLLYEEEQYNTRHSRQENYQLAQDIEDILITIAKYICLINKDFAMQICQQLTETKEIKYRIYDQIIQKEDNHDKKIIYMKEFYEFLNRYSSPRQYRRKQRQIQEKLRKILRQMQDNNHPQSQYSVHALWLSRVSQLNRNQPERRQTLDHEQIKYLLNDIKGTLA